MQFLSRRIFAIIFALIVMQQYKASAEIKISAINPISNKKILPNGAFPSGDSTIRIVACAGEYEPGSIVVRLDSALSGVKPVVTDLKCGENIIPASNVNIKYVLCWWQEHTAWKAVKAYYKKDKYKKNKNIKLLPPQLVPELLVNDPTLVKVSDSPKSNKVKLSFPDKTEYIDIPCKYNKKIIPYSFAKFPVKDMPTLQAIDLPADKNQQIWLTVKTPDNAVAGLYTGKLNLEKDGNVIASIPIKLRVLPFKLAKSRLSYGLYYIGALKINNAALTCYRVSSALMKKHWKNMLEHGIDNWIVYQPWEEDLSLRALEKVLKIRQELGINDRPLYYCGLTTAKTLRSNSRVLASKPETIAKFKKILTKIKKLCDKYKVPEFYIYACDENHKARAQDRIKLWKIVHDAGGKVMTTQYHPQKSIAFKKDLDLLIYGYGLPNKLTKEFHKYGNKVVAYCSPQVGVENPWLYRMQYGQKLWSSGLDGVMNYAYIREMGNPWNDFDHLSYRDHLFVYPTINGFIETIAWEGMREAVDDTRYITTLEKCIKNTRGQKKTAKQAKLYLSVLKKNASLRNPATVRLEVINWILKLKGAQI